MLNFKNSQAGFTLIEVVAAAALLGLLVTMAMPSLSAANAKVKNSRLKADLATVDQAIQLYMIDEGKLPDNLSKLRPGYLSGSDEIKDAKNEDLQYTQNGSTYSLTGKDAAGATVTSNGSSTTSNDSTTTTETTN
ncbi:MAG: prepilin-type N-terminal cleavage/methylation domain-containing protein [Phascolarctobacterium sp.]|nr:prepilin-type N-terminal cleavage/methylation domain-containing protein [Phascolarctobacterium sp.]